MKSAPLLLIAVIYAQLLNAQVRSNAMVQTYSAPGLELTNKKPVIGSNMHSGKKTTSFTSWDWFRYNIAMDSGGTGTTSALLGIYPDSNIYVTSGASAPFYLWTHGIGVSFDPTSPYFSTGWVPTTTSGPGVPITDGNNYLIDTIEIAGLYQRVNSAYPDDTLYIDVTYTSDTGALQITYSSSMLVSYGIIPTPATPGDTMWTIADAYYNWSHNAVDTANTTPVWRFTKILNAAAAVDTNANGISQWRFPAPGIPPIGSRPWPMYVPAGKKVVAYAHFATGHNYPLGTPDTAANMWLQYTQDFDLHPLETYYQDRNCGLVATIYDRYHISDTGTNTYSVAYLPGGGIIPVLTATYFYNTPKQIHNPWFGFYATCLFCTGISNTYTQPSHQVSVYPSPGNNELAITYFDDNNAAGTATLINMQGQIVASQPAANGKVAFNTAALPDGIYIYTLAINGQRNTGKAVISH